MRMVLDTNILVAARRSRQGASNELLRALDRNSFVMIASVPLFLEYESVLFRPDMRRALGASEAEVAGFLDYLSGIVEPVRLSYLWRPQLPDPKDEMVLEAAVNGRANAIVTFNARDFGAASRFGIEVLPPSEALRRISS